VATSTLEPPAAVESSDSASLREATSQIVSFRLANEEYGIDIMRVQEIILIGHITQMPNVPPYVRGLINLRGHVLPIIDLGIRFGLGDTEPTEQSRIIVLNQEARTVGIIVDAVDEVLRINVEQIEEVSSAFMGAGQDYVRSLVKFKSKLLILLDVDRLLAGEDVTASAGA